MGQVEVLKAQIYDEILKHKAAERNIVILEQQLQEEVKKVSQPSVESAEQAQMPAPSAPAEQA